MSYILSTELAAYALNDRYLSQVDSDKITAAINSASSMVDSYLRSHINSLPLTTVPELIKKLTADIAIYYILTGNGMRADEFDEIYRLNYQDALTWLRDFSNGKNSLGLPPAVASAKIGNSSGSVFFGRSTSGNLYRVC